LQPDDEVSLWAFFNRDDIRMVVPFTSDTGRVAQAVQGLSPSGATPLAASIARAGGYLLAASRHPRRVMVILSDGEETCNGNPSAEIRALQKAGVNTR